MLKRFSVLGRIVGTVLYSKKMYSSTLSRSIHFFFHKNLLLTNSLTSGGFMCFGDLVQQEFEYHRYHKGTSTDLDRGTSKSFAERYDWARAGRMLIVGCLMGPWHHYYYLYLDKLLPNRDFKTVAMKVAGDQFFCAPATILFFFGVMGQLEKKSTEEITREIQNKFQYVYLGDCLFWPPIQCINFYYLPTQYRLLYINAATMVFDVFLSFMKHDFEH